jgi:F0F1-type ATP synthase membrane subunit c/vacuolar-type H+-ATPase subunit K
MDLIHLIHYLSVGLCTFIPSLGVSIGQAKTTEACFDSMNTQPAAREELSKTLIIALALIETAGLLGVISSLLLVFHKTEALNVALGQLGVVFAMCITGFMTAVASSFPAREALLSIARQPFASSAQKISNLMILCQSLIQTPLAFGFIITLLIYYQLNVIATLGQAVTLIAAGLCIGLASIGPAIGGGLFTKSACKSIGLNSTIYTKIISFTIISQAIIETPIIFAVIISFWLLSIASSVSDLLSIVSISIACLMGIGTLAAVIGSGKTAASGVSQLPFIEDKYYNALSKTTIIAQGLIDTSAIYALMISIVLILTAL